jgi:oligoendopeptidase F
VYDLGDRPGKRARAFCAPTRVPEEVYLVLRPHGGLSDYTTLLHEAGHALHFANVRADFPFEYRWLGDNSITESYAMLFDHRMQDKGWLLRYTEIGTSKVNEFLRLAGFEELHYLRRYCAKLIYEVEAYADRADWNDLPDLYVDTLTAATNFQYRSADAFIDFDPRYYSTRYLRAWQLQALLNESLVERFDIDWFRNPSAGPWMIRELWGEGQRETAEELAARVAMRGEKLSFAPLIRNIGKLLGN